jgi:hypothetical protein
MAMGFISRWIFRAYPTPVIEMNQVGQQAIERGVETINAPDTIFDSSPHCLLSR